MSQFASRLKWIVIIIVVVLATIVVFQNLGPTKVEVLFFTREMPHAVLLTLTLLLGFLLGLSASTLWKVRAWRARHTSAKHESVKKDAGKVEPKP